MSSCPLYKSLKSNGNTFYAFPGSSEDISAAYMNSNYKMYFSKYALINLPKQNTVAGSQSNPIYFNFSEAFKRSSSAPETAGFNDPLVESLRNYVANQEVVIRESRLNNQQYYYDTNALETATEKVFFKWCKKLGLIDFEPAIPEDEYFSNLTEFQSRNSNSDEYFPEYLWKEREVVDWDVINCYESSEAGQANKLELEFNGETNFRVGDTIRLFNFGGGSVPEAAGEDGTQVRVRAVLSSTSTQGQRVVVDYAYTGAELAEPTGQAELVYHRLVQYIGEVNGVSNVQEANRSYTEVYAHIPDHTGMTPDILFRTSYDVNYKPNMTFPILPSQYQPEIMGAELFNSPIVSNPQNYPGSYLGQFDTVDFTYETSSGDTIRRSGDYYGVKGDTNAPVVDTAGIDGIGLDFDTAHYVKMNLANRAVTNFDQFNAIQVNNAPPNDFEFNAILWYYTVEDSAGNSRTNLYGVSFLDNPDNNPVESEAGFRFPTYKKLVANGDQDGSSFAFSLNLNFNIINENPQESYNPEAINSVFSMNLFNNAMSRLASTNDSFLNILADQNLIKSDILALKGLIYSQTELSVINAKIASLENLLRLYSTNQMSSSDSISVTTIPGSPPYIRLENIDTGYSKVDYVKTTDLYNIQGIIPLSVAVPTNRDWLVYLSNNDETPLALQNDDRLTITFDRDLDFRQTVEIHISASEFSTQNKRLDIYMKSDISTTATELLLLGGIDLPVAYNSQAGTPNSAARWKGFNFGVDFSQPMTFRAGPVLELGLQGSPYVVSNSVKVGDTLSLDGFFVGVDSPYDFSGQYAVAQVGLTSSYIHLDVSANKSLVTYTENKVPMQIHGLTSSALSNAPSLSINRGKRISITRISDTAATLSERYRIVSSDL